MKQLITIVAMSVDSRTATLYKVDGSTVTINQGDARLPAIVEKARYPLSQNQPVEVDITPILPKRHEYEDAEKGTNGVIKFFRVAKKFLKELIDTESPTQVDEKVAHVSPLEVGYFPWQKPEPVMEAQPEVAEPAIEPELTNDQKLDAARDRMHQVVGVGKGTETAEFHAPLKEDGEDTIVAVHMETGAVIPDAHKLGHQLRAASKLQDYTGFTRFVERLSLIIDDRGHSVEDLMKFIEKGDLPIADDGCIVIYKRLSRRGSDVYVDVHSGKIKQKVGSYVFMKPGLVDPNRRQDCSNGLHVASLSYLSQFSGDVTIIAKVRPEDVFAVPEYNTNKMRVCGYHIVAELSESQRHLVNGGGSLSSTVDGKILLNKILRGDHIGVTQYVEVGGQHGTNVTYTDVNSPSMDAVSKIAITHSDLKNETLNVDESLEPVIPTAPEVEATSLKPVEEVTPATPKAQAEAEPAKPKVVKETTEVKRETKAETAKRLWSEYYATPNAQRLETLVAFKKAAKKSWASLGIGEDESKLIEEEYAKLKDTTVKVNTISDFAGVKPVAKKQPKVQSFFTPPVKGTGPKAQMAEVLKDGVKDAATATKALEIKKAAKKSWHALGVSDADEKRIIELLDWLKKV